MLAGHTTRVELPGQRVLEQGSHTCPWRLLGHGASRSPSSCREQDGRSGEGSRPRSGPGAGSLVKLLPGQPLDQPAEEGQLSKLLAGDQGRPRRKEHCEPRGGTTVAPPWTVKGPSEKSETLARTLKEVKELFHPSLWSVNIN